jgi:hypothetical protein
MLVPSSSFPAEELYVFSFPQTKRVHRRSTDPQSAVNNRLST